MCINWFICKQYLLYNIRNLYLIPILYFTDLKIVNYSTINEKKCVCNIFSYNNSRIKQMYFEEKHKVKGIKVN